MTFASKQIRYGKVCLNRGEDFLVKFIYFLAAFDGHAGPLRSAKRSCAAVFILSAFSVFAQQDAVMTPVPLSDNQLIRQSAVALTSNNPERASHFAEKIKKDAARLYLLAVIDQMNGKPDEAIKKAAEVVAFHYQDAEWLPRSELLCAELYVEVGMTNAAETVVRQIQQLYGGTKIAEKAATLDEEIMNIKKQEAK